jgi:hypothetical protein
MTLGDTAREHGVHPAKTVQICTKNSAMTIPFSPFFWYRMVRRRASRYAYAVKR